MPGLINNPHFRINTMQDLSADIAKCFTLYDVSLYLSTKID